MTATVIAVLNTLVLIIAFRFFWIRWSGMIENSQYVIKELRGVVSDTKTVTNILLVHLENLSKAVDRGVASVNRIEVDRASVAADLIISQETIRGVAKDLKSSHERADAITDGHPGEASDAAAKLPQGERQ